jgi:hypothetical protein
MRLRQPLGLPNADVQGKATAVLLQYSDPNAHTPDKQANPRTLPVKSLNSLQVSVPQQSSELWHVSNVATQPKEKNNATAKAAATTGTRCLR